MKLYIVDLCFLVVLFVTDDKCLLYINVKQEFKKIVSLNASYSFYLSYESF